jgi:hypothetical protein
MGRAAKWVLTVVGALGITLMAMQNCSQVEFEQLQSDELRKISDENAFVVGTRPVQLENSYQSDESGSESTPNLPDEAAEVEPPGNDTADGGTTDVGGVTESTPPAPEGGILACGQLEVQDIIIDITSIEVRVRDGEKYQLNIGSGPADLLDLARGIDFVPDRNMDLQEMRVILGEENYVLTNNGQTYPLKSQSQQNAGLLVKIDGKQELIKDVTYHLTMLFEPEFHIKSGGGECILHPNVTATLQ